MRFMTYSYVKPNNPLYKADPNVSRCPLLSPLPLYVNITSVTPKNINFAMKLLFFESGFDTALKTLENNLDDKVILFRTYFLSFVSVSCIYELTKSIIPESNSSTNTNTQPAR
jgi:hypothetical protein